jgi:hypothetical protein
MENHEQHVGTEDRSASGLAHHDLPAAPACLVEHHRLRSGTCPTEAIKSTGIQRQRSMTMSRWFER